MNHREPTMWRLLRSLGCRLRTADIYIMPIGSHPREDDGIRVIRNAREMHVLRFMFALGVEQFSEQTRAAMYANNRPIRLHDVADVSELERE